MDNGALFRMMLFFCFTQKIFCVDIDCIQRFFGSNVLSIYWGCQVGRMACLLAPVQLERLDHRQRIGIRLAHGLFAYVLSEGLKAFLQKKVWNEREDIDHDCIQKALFLSGLFFCTSYASVCSYHIAQELPSLGRDVIDCSRDLVVGYCVYSGFFVSDPKKQVEKMLNASKRFPFSPLIQERVFSEVQKRYRQEFRVFAQDRNMFCFPRDVLYTKEQREWLLNVQRVCALSATFFPVDIKQQITAFIGV